VREPPIAEAGDPRTFSYYLYPVHWKSSVLDWNSRVRDTDYTSAITLKPEVETQLRLAERPQYSLVGVE
jgi:hypothetical protein